MYRINSYTFITAWLLFLCLFTAYAHAGNGFQVQGNVGVYITGSGATRNYLRLYKTPVRFAKLAGFSSCLSNTSSTSLYATGWYSSGSTTVTAGANYYVGHDAVSGIPAACYVFNDGNDSFATLAEADEAGNVCSEPLEYSRVLRNNLQYRRNIEVNLLADGVKESTLLSSSVAPNGGTLPLSYTLAGKGCGAPHPTYSIEVVELVQVAPNVVELVPYDSGIQSISSISIDGDSFPTPNGGFQPGMVLQVTIPFQSSGGTWGTFTRDFDVSGGVGDITLELPLYDSSGNKITYGNPSFVYKDPGGNLVPFGDGGSIGVVPGYNVTENEVRNPNQEVDPEAPDLPYDPDYEAPGDPPTDDPNITFKDPTTPNVNDVKDVDDRLTDKEIAGDMAVSMRQLLARTDPTAPPDFGTVTVRDEGGTDSDFDELPIDLEAVPLDIPEYSIVSSFFIPWPNKFGGDIHVDFSDYESIAAVVRVMIGFMVSLFLAFMGLRALRQAVGGS